LDQFYKILLKLETKKTKMITRNLPFCGLISWVLILVCASGFQTAIAQDSLSKTPSKSSKWHYRVEPYLLFPNMVGQTGISGLPLADIDASTGDIFGSLKIGAMLNIEATKGKWTIASDFLYMNLEQDLKPSNVITGGKVNAKQMGWELAGLRRMNKWLELGVAGMLNALEVDMDINIDPIGGTPETISKSQSKTWVDPMLIARLSSNPAKKVTGQFRGEIGGFGIGSDFAWQIQALGSYRFSKLFDISAGYRAISLDYTSGTGNKAFVYDVITHGPTVKFGFSF
jgi:hypothetical protein